MLTFDIDVSTTYSHLVDAIDHADAHQIATITTGCDPDEPPLLTDTGVGVGGDAQGRPMKSGSFGPASFNSQHIKAVDTALAKLSNDRADRMARLMDRDMASTDRVAWGERMVLQGHDMSTYAFVTQPNKSRRDFSEVNTLATADGRRAFAAKLLEDTASRNILHRHADVSHAQARHLSNFSSWDVSALASHLVASGRGSALAQLAMARKIVSPPADAPSESFHESYASTRFLVPALTAAQTADASTQRAFFSNLNRNLSTYVDDPLRGFKNISVSELSDAQKTFLITGLGAPSPYDGHYYTGAVLAGLGNIHPTLLPTISNALVAGGSTLNKLDFLREVSATPDRLARGYTRTDMQTIHPATETAMRDVLSSLSTPEVQTLQSEFARRPNSHLQGLVQETMAARFPIHSLTTVDP